MAVALDPRLVKITILIDNTEPFSFDQQLMISASGTKYANPLQGEASATIFNIKKSTQDYLLTKTSPYNLDPVQQTLIIEAGRESYGLTEIYRGNIILSGMTQPPDIGVTFRCLTNNLAKGNIVTVNAGQTVSLKLLSEEAARLNGLESQFEATNRNIVNAAYSGDAAQLTGFINSMGGVNVFINGKVLVVKDAFVPLKDTTRILSADTGMIGIPEFTEQGLRVRFLLDNKTTIGGGLQIESKIYPAINGLYYIYKLGFDIASRDTPFYYIAEAAKLRGSSVGEQ